MIFSTKQILFTAIALVVSTVSGQAVSATASSPAAGASPVLAIPNTKIPWKNEYPQGESKPSPKAEWVSLVKDGPELRYAPNTLIGGLGGEIVNSDPTGNNSYCNWSWGGCLREDFDIVSCTDKTVWGTSFDDGPYPVTLELLAYLRTINVKVTFFVVGKQAVLYPEIVRQAFNEGHEIGVHTWDHSELTTLTNDMVIGQLKWTALAVQEIIGVTPRLMRPPRGDIDDRVRYIVRQLGMVPAMWSVDSQDWRISTGGQTEELLIANVTEWANTAAQLTRGGNSLMHDLSNVTVGADIKALPALHEKVKLSPVGTCAGWNNQSYVEYMNNAATNTSTGRGAVTSSSSSPTTFVSPAAGAARAQSGATGSLKVGSGALLSGVFAIAAAVLY
ncbi:carbohydrate esterase family 4 protein [Backusella circina FSU 941]|nr:carbohydrate esterase family 4 protein [Backusella circina FSU 941]